MTNLQFSDHDFKRASLTDIETALDHLWREANDTALAAGGNAVARNSVLTLVAYTTSQERVQHVIAAVEELTRQHPARAIMLLAEPERQGADMDAYIAVHREGAGASATYGEEILIDACGDAARHVPGVALPLMVTGLPAFLWWHGEPPWGTSLLETLVDGSDRLIVDSSEFADGDRGLGAAAELMQRKYTRCAVSDFNWTRQAPWRELTAQFFDSAALRPYLTGIDRVTVEYAASDEDEPTNSTHAYLFAAWLASRLGWSLPSSHRRSFGPVRQHTLHDGNGRPVLIEISARYGMQPDSWYAIDQRLRQVLGGVTATPQPSTADGHQPGLNPRPKIAIGHGALMSVRIHAVAQRLPGTFIIARDEDLEHATTLCQVDDGAPPSHTVHLPSLGETSLLHSQLQLLGHDSIYEDALATAARLVGFDVRRAAI